MPILPLVALALGAALTLGTAVALAAVVATASPLQPQAERSLADRPDEVAGSQVHVMYVLPSDGQDRRLDVDGTLANSVGSFQTWLAGQTGGRRLRLDTYRGAPDITFVRLARSDSLMRSYGPRVRGAIEWELSRAGLLSAGKVYAVYYDGGSTHACGSAAWPPETRGRVGAVYLRGTSPGARPCNYTFVPSSASSPGYLELSVLHEILHTLGFVAEIAPHEHARGHVPEPNDLMYDGGAAPWALSEVVLDVGQDDYYGSNVPAAAQNFAHSPFLMHADPAGLQTAPVGGSDTAR